MISEFYIATTYLKLLLSSDQEAAAQLRIALGDSFQSALDKEYLSGETVVQLFHEFENHGVQSWALAFGSQLSIASHGPLGFAALSSPDLSSALKVLSEFLIIRINAVHALFEQTSSRLQVSLSTDVDDELTERWLIEANLLVLKTFAENITGHPLGDQAQICFRHSRPTYADQLDEVYEVPCQYGCATNYLSVPASWAHIPSPLYDEATYRANLVKCREMKLELSLSAGEVTPSVRARLLGYFDRNISGQAQAEQLPDLDTLAAENFMSVRTLIRKLQAEGKSYKSILRDIRAEQACYLLKNTHLTAAEISEKLAYQEPANFARAFKTWFNCTPTRWRRQR